MVNLAGKMILENYFKRVLTLTQNIGNAGLKNGCKKTFQCLNKNQANNLLIPSYILSFHKIYERLVHHLISPGSGVVACKIPVACIGGAGFMKIFYGLVYYINRDADI